jgi:hypothetical protein
LTLAYEALRAQATGQLPATTPRGLALFLMAGFPDWMKASTPLAPVVPKTPAPHHRQPPTRVDGEVVQLLAEMALSCQRKGTT